MQIVLLLALVAVLAILPVVVPWLIFSLTLALASGFAALGVGLLLRAGLITIGQALFFACGAYAVAFLQRDLGIEGLLLLLIAATAITALAGVIVGSFMVRYRGIFFAMLNLAAAMVFYALLSKLYGITGGTDGISVHSPTVLGMVFDRDTFSGVLYYGALALALLIGYGVYRYTQSPMGKALSAVHANEIRLSYLGISVRGVLLASYTLSAALAGLGGSIAAIVIGRVLPHMSYWTESGALLVMAVIGGAGGVAGPFVGSFFVTLIHAAASSYGIDLWNLVTGIALLIVIFFLPEGLYGLGSRLLNRRKQP